MKYQAVKGTRDFYPREMAIRNWIVQAWRRVSLRHGFEEYDGPIFEYLDLYKAKSGEGIVGELFHFKDRGDRDLAIRPEMTPTLARMIAAQAQSLPRPIKWFSVPRLCRAERPQRGRLREFFQWNADIVGSDDALADAECIWVMLDFFREVGLGDTEVEMRINSRSLLAALLVARGIDAERHGDVYAVLDKRDKLPPEVYAAKLAEITRNEQERADLETIMSAQGSAGLVSVRELAAGNAAAEAELRRLHELLELLATMGHAACCVFDMGVVRGLAYYTGVVFEGFGKGELKRAVCGGGRYDHLLSLVGGPPMSGIGFGTSDVVILDLLNEFGKLPAEAAVSKRVDCVVIDADAAWFPTVLKVVAGLRQAGLCAEFSYKRMPLGKQLKWAAGLASRYAVIVGEEYRERSMLAVKNLSTGQQREVSAESFLSQPDAAMSEQAVDAE